MRGSHLLGAGALWALTWQIALADPPLGTNLLQNSGFGSSSANGWVVESGTYGHRTYRPGGWYYYAGESPVAVIRQEFDLAALGYDPLRLETGGYYVTYGGMQRSVYKDYTSPSGMGISWADVGEIGLDPFADVWNSARRTSLGESWSSTWVTRQATVRLKGGTTHIRYWFRAEREDPPGVPAGLYPENLAALTDAYLRVHEYDIWTHGSVLDTDTLSDVSHAGDGDWATGSEMLTVVGFTADGTVCVTNGRTWSHEGDICLGWMHGSVAGTVNIDGGTWRTEDVVDMGWRGTGRGLVNVSSGGAWHAHKGVVVGARGEANVQSGGTLSTYEDVLLEDGGTVNVQGGTWNAHGTVDLSGGAKVGVSDGTWNANMRAYVGHRGEGEVNVNSGGMWNSGLAVWVGDEGTGQVNVNAGGSWAVATLNVGKNGGSGTVNVAGGVLETASYATVGDEGTGVVKVASGGTWDGNNTIIDIGEELGTGDVVLEPGSTWNVNGRVCLGLEGEGRVTVLADATWRTGGHVYVGESARWEGTAHWGSGEVAVAGTWDANGAVAVGNIWGGRDQPGSWGTVWVLDTGTWNTRGTVTVGKAKDAVGQVAVRGDWIAEGAVRIGEASPAFVGISDGGMLEASDLTLGPAGELTIEGGTLAVVGGEARLTGVVDVKDGGTIRLDNARLLRAAAPLDLNGGQVVGTGRVDAPLGVMLGAAERPGSLTGAGPLERLVVNGDVAGSGSLTHVTVYGQVSVGASAGEMSLANVLLGDGSSMAMEVLGLAPNECDRLLIGPGVDFAGCPIEISFEGGFTPDAAGTFDLFGELPGGDLAAALGTAAIHTPIDWQLDLSTGTLSYVPEPATLGLLLLGGAGLLRRRRET